MSLLYSEPRVASVVAVTPVVCMSLTKEIFTNQLSDAVKEEVKMELEKRKETRLKREKSEVKPLVPRKFSVDANSIASMLSETNSSKSEVTV
jgi:CRP-like cAMP-binding protein